MEQFDNTNAENTEIQQEIAKETDTAPEAGTVVETKTETDSVTDIEPETEVEGKKSFVDFSNMGKAEITSALEEIIHTGPVQSIRNEVEAAKTAFYKVYRSEVEQLKKEFIDGGGSEDGFSPPVDTDEEKLKLLLGEYRMLRDKFTAESEHHKEENYKVKLKIIEELKELVNSNETLNHTFSSFRELQNAWKEAGPVPQAHVKDLWETYHLHVENFYNYIKINNELRDLDLKKNTEIKIKLCEEAEALLLDTSAVSSFNKLQKLHEQWRETGPVSNEYKEQLWERFREASSKINKRHQEYFEGIKNEQRHNLELKTELCVKAEELMEKPLETRSDWDKASDELMEIQKVWKTIGFAPRKDNTAIYERFRAACDKFFESKREFYGQVKGEMDGNLKEKTEICLLAESLRDSTDWKKTTDELIALQKRWKEIGPVPRKYSDAIWKRFRAACDAFFENKKGHFSGIDSKYGENLAAKRALLEEIRNFEIADRESGFESLKAFQRRWAEIGFVPIKEKDKLQDEYRRVIDEQFARIKGDDRERKIERYRDKISTLKEHSKGTLRGERDRLYNKVRQLESDIALLGNNIGFFAKSKNAEAMIREVNNKIEKAKEEMAVLIDKIALIDSQNEG